MYNFTANKNEWLKKATLKTQYLNRHHLTGRSQLVSLEGESFKLFMEESVANRLEAFESVKVIISFQWYEDGRKIAVARLHRDVQKVWVGIPTTLSTKLH